jgi:shikimate dehydrogenase
MRTDDPLLVRTEWLHSGMFVYDLIYNPQKTELLKVAEGSGCLTANGLGMLLWQGVLAFQFWTGKHAPVDVMRKALMEKINA